MGPRRSLYSGRRRRTRVRGRQRFVMAGHSRPRDGVASLAYVPAISLRDAQCHPKRDHRVTRLRRGPVMTTTDGVPQRRGVGIVFDQGSDHAGRQEETEVQKLRRQRSDQTGRQESEMSALRRHRLQGPAAGAPLAHDPEKHVLDLIGDGNRFPAFRSPLRRAKEGRIRSYANKMLGT